MSFDSWCEFDPSFAMATAAVASDSRFLEPAEVWPFLDHKEICRGVYPDGVVSYYWFCKFCAHTCGHDYCSHFRSATLHGLELDIKNHKTRECNFIHGNCLCININFPPTCLEFLWCQTCCWYFPDAVVALYSPSGVCLPFSSDLVWLVAGYVGFEFRGRRDRDRTKQMLSMAVACMEARRDADAMHRDITASMNWLARLTFDDGLVMI